MKTREEKQKSEDKRKITKDALILAMWKCRMFAAPYSPKMFRIIGRYFSKAPGRIVWYWFIRTGSKVQKKYTRRTKAKVIMFLLRLDGYKTQRKK